MTLKRDAKFEKRTDLLLGRWHEKLDKSSPEHSKVSKVGTLMGSFCPKLKMYEPKI